MPNRFYTRRFLNRRGHHAGAYVLASVEDTSKRKSGRGCSFIQFIITDCNRQISLDFDACPDDLANSLHKADILIETLTKLRAALVEEGAVEAARHAAKDPREAP